MKKTLRSIKISSLYILILFSANQSFAQEAKKDMKENRDHFYDLFDEYQKCTIIKYWKQYFVKDIIPDLASYKSDLSKITEQDYHPLFLDSYGCMYCKNFYSLDYDFKQWTKKDINLLRYSHYQNVRCDSGLKEKLLKEDSIKFKCVPIDPNAHKKTANPAYLSNFNNKWNEVFLTPEIDCINEKLRSKENIVFFVHGYNVPYSLAVIQMLMLREKMQSAGLNVDNTLFVPIFWSSGDLKKKNIKPEKAKNFNVGDKFRYRTAQGWLYYSNRAYYAAITLRNVLNKIDVDSTKNVMIFAHSLGATIATSACINTTSKLDNRDISNDLRKKFTQTPIPTIPIKIFLSAPAIPGVNTFTDMDSCFSNKVVFSTVNNRDRMLSKFKFINPKRLSSTTLGSDYKGEASETKRLFMLKDFCDNFIYRKVSCRKDHDIFTYMRQDEYLKLLKEFIEKK